MFSGASSDPDYKNGTDNAAGIPNKFIIWEILKHDQISKRGDSALVFE
jgi:hypothetical protein